MASTWIEEEQAFNFAVHSEHAESVTLLLYSPADLVNPLLRLQLDFLHNKSGRIWHCRVPVTKIGDARYYAYSVSGETIPQLHSFDPQKVLLDPYAKCIFFPPGFDRNLAMREGSNAGHAPLGVLIDHRSTFDWSEDRPPVSRVGCSHLRTSRERFHEEPKLRCRPFACRHLCRSRGKDSLSEGTRGDGRRTDAGFSARSTGRRLLGLYAFEFLRAACSVREHTPR